MFNPPTKYRSAYRAHLRIFLFAAVAVLTAWWTFTSYSAQADQSSAAKAPNPQPSAASSKQLDADTRTAIDQNYGQLSLSFEANRGQAQSSAKYVARGPGYNIFLTPDEAVLVLKPGRNGLAARPTDAEQEDQGISGRRRSLLDRMLANADENRENNDAVLRMQLIGGNTPSAIEGVDELPGKVNYFIGNDSSKWVTDIATFSKVRYQNVYPGIDMLYYGNRQQLEYDFIVAPGSDPSVIAMKYQGASSIRVDHEGNLVIKTTAGELRQMKPIVYQEVNGKKIPIDGRYVVNGGGRVGFRVSNYDRKKPLVIDPILVYSSIINAAGYGYSIAVDPNGFAYVAGTTFNDFNPTSGAFQTSTTSLNLISFVTKLNQNGTDVVYSTYLGGNGQGEALGVATDPAGNAYVTGYVAGTFPITPGAYQPALASDFDAFVTKLNPTGSALVYSTFYGGSDFEEGVSIAVDAVGNAFIVGDSRSKNLPITSGASQTTHGGGSDGFLARFNPNGTSLTYATYYGGGGSEFGVNLSVDQASNVYVVGETSSLNYPQVNALQGPNGLDRGIFRSTNNGASWNLSNSGLLTSHILSFTVHPVTPTTIYAGTLGGVSKSTDGGVNWFSTGPTSASVRSIVIDPTNPNTVYAGTVSGVFKTTNGGVSWTLINNGLTVLVSNINPILAIRQLAINPTSPNTIYAATSLGIFRTTDGGANWATLNVSSGLPSRNIQTVVVDPTNPSNVFLGLSTSGVYKSTNGGTSWTVMNTGLNTANSRNIRSMTMVQNLPTTIYVGTIEGVFKTIDGGANWTAANNGFLAPYTDSVSRLPAAVNVLAIDPVNSNTIYAGVTNNIISTGAYPLTAVLKTTDGGANWSAITNGFGVLNNGVLALAVNPVNPATIYAGTAGDFDGFLTKFNANGGGIYYSTYVGSSRSDYVAAVATDSAFNVYIYGWVSGTNLPVTQGAFDQTLSGATDTFAMKLNSTASSRLYSTYLGGGATEDSYGLAVDSAGSAHVFGWTTSTNLPVTPGSFQSAMRSTNGTSDSFVTKINAAGNGLDYSSYLGGSSDELFDFQGNNLALDSAGNVYVVGSTFDLLTFPVFNFVNAIAPPFDFTTTFVTKVSTATNSWSIRGRITDAQDVGIFGMPVQATNTAGLTRTTYTDDQGFYSLPSLPGGDYTVTPQRDNLNNTHYVFTPASRNVPNLNSDQTANFVATRVHDITGRVTSSTIPGLGIFDVTITATGASTVTATTDANGNYRLMNLVRDGAYTIVASKTGFTFEPPQYNFPTVSGDISGADFTTASGTFFTISGRVANAGNNGIPNLTVFLVTIAPGGTSTFEFVATDANGNYSFPNRQSGGNYLVVPFVDGFQFIPNLGSVDNLSANTVFNFTGTTCTFTPSLVGQGFGSSSGTGGFNITATSDACSWSTVSNAPWITITSPANVNGNGAVSYTITANPSSVPRTGTITVANQIFTVTQAGASCAFNLSSTSQAFTTTGGNGSVGVTATPADCGWLAQSNASWITIPNATSVNGNGTVNYVVAANLTSFARSGTMTIAGQTFTVNQAASPLLRFSAASYTVGEGGGTAQIAVTRGDTAAAATVDYATSDTAALTECNVFNGIASSRCDYATSIGTLRFAAGEASKTIFIPLIDDVYAEGNEVFTITLSNATGNTLATPTSATITIQDNETVTGVNPIDGVDFFIRQNYIDFLGREPDPAGLAGWRNVLVNCGTTVQPPCDRIEVSAGFFRSEEFQSRGYFIYRFYSAVGRIPLSNEFFPDFAKLSGFLTPDQLEAAKSAYVLEVIARQEFQTKYSSTFGNPTGYVDALLATVGLPAHPSRAGWIATLNTSNTAANRALVLRQLVESAEVYNRFYNEAFVIMQYFGYLRRTADASYLTWIQTMNTTGGDYRIMINGFMNSAEYRRRFGP